MNHLARTVTFFALAAASAGCAAYQPPPHGMIEQAYFRCDASRNLEGGIYGKGPTKRFGPKQPACASKEWVRISHSEFKRLASQWYGYDWSKEIPFWSRELSFPENGAFVLPQRVAPQMLRQCSRATPANVTGYWTPDKAAINQLEAALQTFLKGEAIPPEQPYHRQYIGIIVAGKKLIYGNFYPEEHESTDQTPLIVCDGGPSYWGIVFDPASGQFSDLRFNGVA